MKRPSGFLLILAFFAMVCGASAPAAADPKPWYWGWWPSHWHKERLDFKPYPEDPTRTHNSQWNKSKWQPAHWIAQRPSEDHLIEGFYRANIISGQYMDEDVPVLEVGPGFYRLGGQDRRRVVETVDQVYGITAAKENGMFMLYDWKTGNAVGSYTVYGLQMQ